MSLTKLNVGAAAVPCWLRLILLLTVCRPVRVIAFVPMSEKNAVTVAPQPVSLTYRPSSYNFVTSTQKHLIFASGVSSSSACYLTLRSSPFPGLHFAPNLRCLLVFLSSLLCRSPAHPTNVQPPYLIQYRARAFPTVLLVPQGCKLHSPTRC